MNGERELRTGSDLAAPALASSVPSRFEPGARIRQYEIIRPLGHGGMGIVYLARDVLLGRRVAIKVLLTRAPTLTRDFLREARATASCEHDNIVVIHEADEYEGTPYMVLEHLDGSNLRQLAGGRKMAPSRAVELIAPVVRALVRAHERNIVHRDLKPENVFITASGAVKVLDFGIAALLADADAQSTGRPRMQARVGGTMAYMATEQFEPGGADHRSDLWAIGIMLYELVAGHHPVQPLTQEALLRHAYFPDQPYPRIRDELPDLPGPLVDVVDRCLQKRKEHRFASAAELLAVLEPLLPGRNARALDAAVSPYPGLAAFQEHDADRFFGRSADVLQVVTRLRDRPVAAVVGASGVGKSSFVRAGVVPALRASADNWEVLVIRPGREALQSLATLILPFVTNGGGPPAGDDHRDVVQRLRESPGHLGAVLRARAAQRRQPILLFVDQLEELYTLVPDERERRAFTACLSGAADDAAAPLRVLVSIRSDFLDRVGEDRRFLDDLVRGLHFLQPLPREALREALEAPVGLLGYSFESPALLAEMVDSLAATPGSLPLLQFAGAKLWEARDTRRKILTAESYRQMGGISGVLAQHADRVIDALPPSLRASVRGLFQRLVTADGTRAIVDVAELPGSDAGDARALVEHLAQARLVVVQNRADEGSATVELVHESLISGWPMLRRWLDEGREDAAFREQLRAAAKQWEARGKPQGLLWRAEAMEEARLWRARHPDPLPDREQVFLDAVVQLGTRAQRVRRGALIGAFGLLSAVVAGGSIAFVKVQASRRDALEQADVASREATRARQAEDRVRVQLDVIKREETAKAAAETAVERGKQDLRAANTDLQKALARAEAESQRAQNESKRAQDAAAKASDLAASAQKTNVVLEKLLAEERARAERFEKERRKIASELK